MNCPGSANPRICNSAKAGIATRTAAAFAVAVLLWFIITKLGSATGVIGYFNSVKRELALIASAAVIVAASGGRMFTLDKALPALSA